MMPTDEQRKHDLGVALNEANLLGFEVSPDNRLAAATFRVLTLPEDGPPPEDSRVSIRFHPVGRVAASLRNGPPDDPKAEIATFDIDELLDVVQSFDGCPVYGPVYGWEFFDAPDEQFEKWSNRLSLDWRSGEDGFSHSITIFQDLGNRRLDLKVWFDKFAICDPDYNQIDLDSFIADGLRWWNAFYEGDERTQGHGLFHLKGQPDLDSVRPEEALERIHEFMLDRAESGKSDAMYPLAMNYLLRGIDKFDESTLLERHEGGKSDAVFLLVMSYLLGSIRNLDASQLDVAEEILRQAANDGYSPASALLVGDWKALKKRYKEEITRYCEEIAQLRRPWWKIW